jgi:catechol 2,3-dioxygenase-like lactoylglutathione lyase family enzyme
MSGMIAKRRFYGNWRAERSRVSKENLQNAANRSTWETLARGDRRCCAVVCFSPAAQEHAMKIVPVIKSSDLQRSVRFYTEVLDFERKWPGYEEQEMANGVVDLVRDGAELQLSIHSGDGVFGSVNRVFVDDVDERCMTFRTRGLNTTQRPESPIHTAPVDQTWGLREFAVTDPDGNNLCFCMPRR